MVEKKQKQAIISSYYERMPVDKLVSLTYDSSPKVRAKAALALERVDDPRAVFALLELTADKEKEVNKTAREILDRVKGRYNDALVSLEKLFAETVKAAEKEEEQDYSEIKKKLMPSLEKLFSRVDKKKAKRIREKLMPSLEKLFSGKGKRFVTVEEREERPAALAEATVIMRDPLSGLEHVPHSINEEEDEGADVLEKDVEEKHEIPSSVVFKDRQSIFERAEQLASNPEVTDSMLKVEEKRIVGALKKEVSLAFKVAKRKARGNRVKGLLYIKDGMSNISTQDVTAGSVESISYKKGRRRIYMFRIVLVDESGKFPLYLSKIRGKGILEGDTVRLENAYVDPSPVADENALFIARRGKVFVVK